MNISLYNVYVWNELILIVYLFRCSYNSCLQVIKFYFLYFPIKRFYFYIITRRLKVFLFFLKHQTYIYRREVLKISNLSINYSHSLCFYVFCDGLNESGGMWQWMWIFAVKKWLTLVELFYLYRIQSIQIWDSSFFFFFIFFLWEEDSSNFS